MKFMFFSFFLFFSLPLLIFAELIKFGNMPEDAMIQTGAVNTVEEDPIAKPLILDHISDTDNPHDLTAFQIEALPATWGGFSLPGASNVRGWQAKEKPNGSNPPFLLTPGVWVRDPSGPHDIVSIMGNAGFVYTEQNTFKWTWPDTFTMSPLVKRDELQQTISSHVDPNSLRRTGDAMLGKLGLSNEGIEFFGSGIGTNFILRVEHDGTNLNFNIYEVSR